MTLTLHGTIRYRDLEGGLWVLETDDGCTLQLAGGDRKLKRDGARATLEGQLDETALTAGMVGPLFRVTGYRFD